MEMGLAFALSFAAAAALPGTSLQPAMQPAPPAEAPPTATSDGQLLDFGDASDRMTVPVTIGVGGPYHFIVDTGAQRTVISRELAGRLGLAPGPTINVTSMSGTGVFGTFVIPALSVGVLGGTRIEAPALESRNLGALGLLGLDTLQGHKVVIDFERQQMAVTPSTLRRHEPAAAYGEVIVHARSVLGQLVVTDAYYHGRRIQVIVDTGSVVTMGNMALRRTVSRSTKGMTSISLLGVTGDVLVADYAQVDQIKVAGLSFNNLPVAFADAEPFKRFNMIKRPALMLGMDAMKMFKRVQIDFPNRTLRLVLPKEAIVD
ncbi:MAG: aspartyl protease family protein [Sphingomonas sp.]|jgi:predicted aspartyl protease|uniref:aspartyl protease family protein n=1 Tax=Sphingomonas sp. TaxID=28214 RepID=UPI0035696FEF